MSNQCDCPPKGTWMTDGLDGRGCVIYRGQIRSRCGIEQDWVCRHTHHTRREAEECAEKKMHDFRNKIVTFPRLDKSTSGVR